MERIVLNNVSPQIFEGQDLSQSEVWQQEEVALLKGKSYLISSQSGAGKSSLCSYIFGHRADYSGAITFNKQDIRTFSKRDWDLARQTMLSILWQDLKLFPNLSVWENIQLKNSQTNYKSDDELIALLTALGIEDKRKVKVEKLSLGQQQRVALIRALCQPFDFLILDEPISHLDEETAKLMNKIIRIEIAKRGAGLIVTSIGQDLAGEFDFTLKL